MEMEISISNKKRPLSRIRLKKLLKASRVGPECCRLRSVPDPYLLCRYYSVHSYPEYNKSRSHSIPEWRNYPPGRCCVSRVPPYRRRTKAHQGARRSKYLRYRHRRIWKAITFQMTQDIYANQNANKRGTYHRRISSRCNSHPPVLECVHAGKARSHALGINFFNSLWILFAWLLSGKPFPDSGPT